MSERNGPSAEERERVAQYLAWRQGHPRIRTVRRRRLWTRGALATLLVLPLIALFAWLSTSRDPRRISLVEPEPPRATPRVEPNVPERPQVQKPAPVPELPVKPKAPTPTVEAPPLPPRETRAEHWTAPQVKTPPVSQPPESSDASPASRDLALPADRASSSDHAEVAAIEPPPATEPPPAPVPPPVTTAPPPVTTQPPPVSTPPPPVTSEPPPAEPPSGLVVEPTPGEPVARTPCEVARRPRTDAGERRGPAVADCVGGWLKGEAQEFRDGVKRGIGDFRTGFDRLRREIRELGDKLSR